MDPLTIGILSFAALALLLLLSVPLGFAMGISGLLGTAGIIGMKPAIALFGTTAFDATFTYELSIIPLFILMGAIAARAGLSSDLYSAFNTWFGSIRGGLAIATIGACGSFAAICGSSVATAATMSKVAMPEMKRFGYDDSLAAGSVAAGGIIGILIPPSVVLVLYGILSETSIGDLFLAGFLPGVLTVIGFMVTIMIVTKLRPEIGPAGEKTSGIEKLYAFKKTWGILLLFTLVIGGLYFGVFTPTEAAGAGVVGALAVAAVRKRLTLQVALDALGETVRMSGMIFVILIGAIALNNLMLFSGMVSALSGFVGGLDLPPLAVVAVILLIYAVLGCFMDAMAMILLTVPIFFPVVSDLGFNPVWFGIVVAMVVELGMITPPIGMNMFIIKGILPHIPLSTIYRGVMPFVLAQLVLIIFVFLSPQVVLWVPETANAFR